MMFHYLTIFFVFIISCNESPPDYDSWWANVQEPIQETDDNDLRVMEEGESPDEVVIEPNHDDLDASDNLARDSGGTPVLGDGADSSLESFRLKSYIRFKPYENIPALVNILSSGLLQLPKKIHVLSDIDSINTGQLASIRHNTTEYCYHGVRSEDPEIKSYFLLNSFKVYDPDNMCVDPNMELKRYYRDPSQLMENGNAYISKVDSAAIRYGYFSEKGDVAILTTKDINSTLYIGVPKDPLPKPGKLNKAKNWDFALKLVPSSSQSNRFSVVVIKGLESFKQDSTYRYSDTNLKIRFTSNNRLEFLVNNIIVASTQAALTGLTAITTMVQSKSQVLPILKSTVTKNLPNTLNYKSPPIMKINSGDSLQLTISRYGGSQQDAVAKARFNSVE